MNAFFLGTACGAALLGLVFAIACSSPSCKGTKSHTWGKWEATGRTRAWNMARILDRTCETCGWKESRDE